MRWMLHALVCAGLVACTPAAEGPTEDPHAAEEHHVTPEVAAEAPDHGSGETAEEAAAAEGPRSFGAAIDEDRPVTALATIVDEPDSYADRIVRTEGEIARVCQAMGCWMELRESEDGPAVRIPMAGHAFFLPRDVAGRRASIEGRVVVQELSPEARAHLEAEGAVATASALSIHATGVVID